MDATTEFFDHTHSQNAIRKMKKLAVARLPEGEGVRKADVMGGIGGGSDGSGSSTPILAILILVGLILGYVFLVRES